MRKFFSKFERIEINYLYFSFLLLCMSFFVLWRFLGHGGPLFGMPLFFMLYALGQALFEVGGFVLTAYLLKRWAPPFLFYLFISICFILLLLHFTDLMMGRILDASISYLFKFLFGFGLDHIGIALAACNLNNTMAAVTIGAILLVPMIGVVLYRITHKVAQKKPMKLSLQQIAGFLFILGAVLFLLDLCAYPYLTRSSYTKYQKALPFGTTFLSPPQNCISLPTTIAPPRDEKSLHKNLPSLALSTKPNLYFFVIETLRKDFITPEIAPHLASFAQENIQFPFSYSNACSTQLSWFSIFHSDFPFHWTAMRDTWKQGSIPLQMLKKLGYKIRVYTSADLRFFGMDELIFGKNRALVDQMEEYLSNALQACDRDLLGLQSFERDLKSPGAREGNVFLFFFDSTHTEYSFPDDFPLRFEPISKQIDYLTLTQKDIEPIKNRYRNSVAYIDSLMGRFFTTLKQENLYEDALIAITGDHGEEFFEEGALFHGTHLNQPQTSVPLYFKFQNNPWPTQTETASHIDLFPSLLHFLTKKSDLAQFFDGQSIFATSRWPYRIAVLQNGPFTPCDFILQNGDHKVTGRFLNPQNIYSQTRLEILSLETPDPIPEGSFEAAIRDHFPLLFDPLLKKPKSH